LGPVLARFLHPLTFPRLGSAGSAFGRAGAALASLAAADIRAP
jgi:hypothetical protein